MEELTEQLIRQLLAAATRSSDADARRLVAEARAEAEAEVKDLLKSAMKAVLLRQAVGELEATARPAPEIDPTPTPAAHEEPRACYVYGIAGAGGLELPSGLTTVDDAAPVSVVTEDQIAAITSNVRLREFEQAALDERVKDLAWVERKVNAHDQVVKAAMAAGAVIPCRFCTVLSDEEEVRRLLRRHAGAIRQTLDRLRGRREWGVKAVYAPGAVDERDDEETVTAASGKSYLLHKRRQGLRRSESLREAEAAAEECHRTLSALAAEAALLPTRDRGEDAGKLLLNGAYLVPDVELDAFEAALDELRARHGRIGLMLSRTGPWPPYNFARLSLTLEPEPPRQTAPDAEPEAAA